MTKSFEKRDRNKIKPTLLSIMLIPKKLNGTPMLIGGLVRPKNKRS